MKPSLILGTVLIGAWPGFAAGQAPAPPASPPASAQPATPPETAQPPAPPAATPSTMPAMSEDRRIQADDIDKALAEGKTLLLDVREPKELQELGTIEGAVNIPLGQLEKRLDELPKDRLILTA
jgi:hypothetical protein